MQVVYRAVSAEPVVFKPVAKPVARIDLLEAVDRSITQVEHWFSAFWIGTTVDHLSLQLQTCVPDTKEPHGAGPEQRNLPGLVKAWRDTQILFQFSQFS